MGSIKVETKSPFFPLLRIDNWTNHRERYNLIFMVALRIFPFFFPSPLFSLPIACFTLPRRYMYQVKNLGITPPFLCVWLRVACRNYPQKYWRSLSRKTVTKPRAVGDYLEYEEKTELNVSQSPRGKSYRNQAFKRLKSFVIAFPSRIFPYTRVRAHIYILQKSSN